jgi:hypothetical protein
LNKIALFSLALLLLCACAQTGQLTGGPIDEAAPKPDSLGIHPPSASINIYPKDIRFTFDEYISLNNPQKNVIFVPNVVPKPTYKIKGKTFIIQFADSSLKPNTTYAIYMNSAVKDFTEGNDSLMNYVFSTGNTIDSLTHTVLVKNAFTDLPEEDVLVGLYTKSDTLNPYNQFPFYFAKTDKRGMANFYYLKKGSFSLFAFKNTANMMKPSLADPIAFKIGDVAIDTSATTDTLALFGKSSTKLRISKKEISLPGKMLFVATRNLDSAKITLERDSTPVDFIRVSTQRDDSVFVWFKGEKNTAYTVNFAWEDTTLSTRMFIPNVKPDKNKFTSNIEGGFVGRFDSLKIFSIFPIQSFDTSKWVLRNEDSVQIPIQLYQNSSTSLAACNKWEEENTYSLNIFPDGITNYYGESNTDTLHYTWQRKPIYKLANLVLVLKNRPSVPLLVELLDDKGKIQKTYTNISDTLLEFKLLDPSEYTVRVTLDENDNQRWDSGDYPGHIQPEKILWFREPIKLRPNWDSKVTLKFSH